MEQLPKKLAEKPFTLVQAKKLGVNRYQLNKLISDGIVELLVRGIYRASKEDLSEEDQYRIATLRVGAPSAICLVSALSYYDLTDMIPRKTWVMVPAEKRTRYPELKLQRTRNPEWQIGVEKQDGYWITSVERTIVDAFCARGQIGIQPATEALRKAIQGRKTTLGRTMEMAKQLAVVHRILPYIEALS